MRYLFQGGKQMKLNYKYGLVAVLAGVFLFIPVFLTPYAFGGYNPKITFFDALNASGLTVFVGVLGLLTMIAAILLIVYGALLFTNIATKELTKFAMTVIIVVSSLALLTAIFAIIDAVSNGWGVDAKPGVGTILYLVFGVLAIAGALVVKFTDKKPVKKSKESTKETAKEPAKK